MNLQKIILGGIVAGVVFFLLGYLTYGMLLKDFMAANYSAPENMRADADMIWWALGAGQLAAGLLLAYVIAKAGATSAGGGAGVGFVVGLLVCLSFDLTMYGVSTTLISLKGIAADVAVSAVSAAIAGAIAGAVMGMGKKAAA